MATDTTNFTPETAATEHDVDFDAVQLAQASAAGAPVQVQIPEGQKVVRVPVTAGETIILPFDTEAVLAGKLGDNGNLAIKVGDVTVILEGYTAAEGQQPVIIETTDGSPIVLADVLAAGKDLDIQTAAGGEAVGAQGADNTGAIFGAFGAGTGIGGFNAIGAQVETELQYGLIDAERKLFLVEREDVDTHPTATNTPGEVDEDGRHHLKENPFDDCYGGINTDPAQPGDEDRSYKMSVKIVDYGPDGPAAVNPLVGDAGDGICRDTDGNLVYSHGEQVLLQWNASENRLEGYVESDPCDCGQIPVEFQKYSAETVSYDEGKGCYIRLVFTATVENGGADGTVCFKLLGPLDHPFNTDPDAETPVYTATLADAEGDGTQGDGDGCCDPYAKWTEFEDNIKLDLLFQAKDGDDASYTPIPFVVDVDDDSPAFLDCDFDPCVGYTLVNDETHGVQCETDDVSVTQCFLNALFSEQVEPGESTIYDKFVQFFGCEALQGIEKCDVTAAETKLKFGYGADGPLVHEICCDGGEGNTGGGGNTDMRTEGLQVDGGLVNPYDVAHGGDCVINCGALLTNSCGDVNFCEDTGLTITIGDCENTTTAHVWMEGIGNTIFGYAYAPQEEDPSLASFQGEGQYGNKIPVFIITIDPDTKELTYVQLHQINHDNPWDPNEANDGGEGSCHVLEQINIGLAITDYDHDSIWTPVHVTILDDGPKLLCVSYDGCEGDGDKSIYSNDFEADDLKGATLIDGYGFSDAALISGGRLVLTDESGLDMQWLKVDGGPDFKGSFHATFDVALEDSGENGSADGFSFQVGNDLDTTIAAEEPATTTGFALTFDTFDNGSPDVIDEVALWFNGVKLGSNTSFGDLNSGSPYNVVVDVDGSNNYSVTINSVVIFSGTLSGALPSDSDFYFGARTGGAADVQAVDNINLTVPVECVAKIDEDFLWKGNHDYDGGAGAHGDDEGYVCATGQVHVDFGTDQPGKFDLTNLKVTDDAGNVIVDLACDISCLKTAKGDPVEIDVSDPTHIVGSACGKPVFSLTIDCDGNFKFELCQALQHPFNDSDHTNDGSPESNWEDNLHFVFGVKAIDCDGDAICTEIKVDVDDDAPAICEVTYFSEDTGYQESEIEASLVQGGGTFESNEHGSLDEDFLKGGNHDYDTDPDNLNNPIGDGNNGDGPGGLCVTGQIHAKVGADRPGEFTFDVPGLCHSGDQVQSNITSADGYPITLTLCQEGCNWVIKGTYVDGVEEGDDTVEAFIVTLDSKTGCFTFHLEAPLGHPDSDGNPENNGEDCCVASYEDDLLLSFGVKLTDADGDYAKTCLEFVVDDDAPVQCRPIDWTVDEDAHHLPDNWEPGAGLPGGIEGGPGDSGTDWIGFTANLNVNFGADGPKEGNPYAFAGVEGDPVTGKDSSGNPIGPLTSHGVAIVYHWDEATSTLSGVAGLVTVFTAHVDQSNGDLTFQLTGPIDHPDTNDDNSDDATDDGKSSWEDEVSIDLAFNACDQDGDAVVAIATVRIDDDSPSLGCVTVDGSEGGPQEGLAAVPEQEVCAVIHVDEDASLDPANRAPGIEGGPGDDGIGGNVVTGHIAFAYGADGPGSFGFDPCEQPDYLKSHGEPVLFKSDGAGGLIAYIATGDETIFTLTVNEGGDFTFTLVRPLDHPGQDDPSTEGVETSYEDNLGFKLVYTVQDYDGDAVKGSLVIDIDDDSPTACQVQAECIDEIFPTHEVSIVAGQPLPAGVTLTAEDQNTANGNTSTVETSSQGIGVNTTPDDGSNPDSDGGASATPGHNRFDEINYTGNLSVDTPGNNSEHLFVNLDGQQLATHATVNLSVFFTGEGGVGTEQGAYRTWKDGVAGDWVVFQAENAGGTKTLNIDDKSGFDRIEFVALPGTTDPSGNQGGDSSDYSIASVVLTVQDKLHTAGDFCADYGADGPGAVALVLPVLPKGEELTSDGSLITLALSDDSHKLTGTIDTLDGPVTVFELSIDPDTGKYCFDLYRPIDGKGADDLHIPVDFTVTDFDGDSVTGSITLCVDPDDVPTIEIVPGERVPVLEGGIMLIDEDAIPGAGGNPGGIGDDAGSFLTGGTVVYDFGGDGPGTFGFDTAKVFDNADTGLTDFEGHKILMDYVTSPGKEGVVGIADLDNSGVIEAGENVDANKFFGLVMDDATGQFVYVQTKPVNHPVSGTEDNLPLSFGVKVTDSNGDAATADIKISIDDDTPEAVQASKTLSAQGVDTNLMIVLDISGSMGDPSGLTALTRLDAAKAAINELFEQYDNLGNVMVRIVTFSTSAAEQGGVWTDLATAHTILNSLSPTNTTNYDAALSAAMGAFPDAGKIVGGQNVSYFISDGKPNAPSGSEGVSPAEQTAWESFVSTNHIVSQAIGIGTGVSATELDPIAYNGVTNSQIPSIIVTDLNNLNTALVGTLSGVVVNGDLDGAPSKFGADGGFVKSVTVDGVTHDFNRAANSVTNTGGGTSYDGVSHVLTIHTLLDGVLAVNLLDGSYNYTRSSDPSDSGVENVGYVLTDNDGDTAPGSLIVNVSAIDLPPIARDDQVITNVSGSGAAVTVADAALLWNDSDANDDAISVTAVGGSSSLTAVHGASSVALTDNNSNGGSFDYTATANGKTDVGHVVWDRGQSGVSTLDGNGLDNILIDRDGQNDTLKGYEGRDVLIGGTGDNLMIGGTGDDLIDLSKGGNDTVRIESKLDGNDIVVGFSTGNAASNDQVNLDALFDSYGPMSGTRADHVTTSTAGSDVNVNVDLDNNTGNGFEMTITLKSVTLANIEVGVSGGDNEVILGS